MKKLVVIFSTVALLLLSFGAAYAWHADGYVGCDVNQNGEPDFGVDTPFEGATVVIENEAGTFSATAVTDASGFFSIDLPDVSDTYTETLDPTSLPDDAVIVLPEAGFFEFTLTNQSVSSSNVWLFDSAICREDGLCWLTAGGVKFNAAVGMKMAEWDRGPKDNVGGNVYPGCDPDPGDGGNWNHLEHGRKLHLKGTDITVIRCGNVDGIEPGSESPVSPFNFIEFEGTGSMVEGSGNNKVSYPEVSFWVRAEDRNEPGNEKALLPGGGADIDRYFLQVFDPDGKELYKLGEGEMSEPDAVQGITITGGNFQIHPCK